MSSATVEREKYIERVRLAREEADLRQEDVARHIGVDRPTYTNYESRRSMPHKYIPKFCEITKVNIEWLMTGTGEMRKNEGELLSSLIHRVRSGFEEDLAAKPLLDSLEAMAKEKEKK